MEKHPNLTGISNLCQSVSVHGSLPTEVDWSLSLYDWKIIITAWEHGQDVHSVDRLYEEDFGFLLTTSLKQVNIKSMLNSNETSDFILLFCSSSTSVHIQETLCIQNKKKFKKVTINASVLNMLPLILQQWCNKFSRLPSLNTPSWLYI